MIQNSVFIIGAGPAGCATAISLMRSLAKRHGKWQVIQVVERKTDSEQVGETIPPAATEALSKINLAHLLSANDHLVCPGSISRWGDENPGFNDFFYMPVGLGFHLDRLLFDRQLLEAAAASGVTQMLDTKLSGLTASELDWTLVLDTPTGVVERQATYIVDATGIKASVARSIGVARNEYDSVVSLCGFYDFSQASAAPAHTLVSTEENGWWYGTQLPKARALVSLCTDSESIKRLGLTLPENWFKAFSKNRWFYEQCCSQFSQELPEPAELITRAAPSAILSRVIGDNWLAVGDAAASYDSISSAGITKALQQGFAAGKAISSVILHNDNSQVIDYQKDLFNAFNSYLRLHQQLYNDEDRYPDSGFWKRRQFG
jgi:flavin-dependent dehydrogenase